MMETTWFCAYRVVFQVALSANARLVYLYICSLANAQGVQLCESLVIAKACSLNNSDVIRAIEELETKQLIIKKESDTVGDQFNIILVERALAYRASKYTRHSLL